MADLAKLTVKMVAENQQLFAELKKSTRAIKRFQSNSSKSLKKVETSFARLGRSVSVFKSAIVAIAGATVVRDLVDTALAFEAVDKTLKAVTGTAESARKEFEFLERVTQRFGINTLEVGDTYSQLVAAFKSSNIEMDIARDLFETMTGTMAGLGRSTAETAGLLTSFIQIANRGKVNYDEFTEQLAKLPGALGLTQRGLGETEEAFRDMLSKGAIPVKDFFIAITKQTKEEFAPAIAEAGNSARASFENFGNALDEVKIAIAGTGVIDFLADIAEGAAKAARAVIDLKDSLIGVAKIQGLERLQDEFNRVNDAITQQQKTLAKIGTERAVGQAVERQLNKNLERRIELLKAIARERSRLKSLGAPKSDVVAAIGGGASKLKPPKGSTLSKAEKAELGSDLPFAGLLPDVGSRELLGEMNKDIEKFEAGIMGARRETEAWEKGIQQTEKAANDLGFVFESRLEDSIIDMTTETVKLRNILRALAQDILRIIIRRAATEPLGDLISAGVRGATGAVTNYIDARGATGDTEAAVNRALGGADLGQSITSSFNDSIARGGALTQIR